MHEKKDHDDGQRHREANHKQQKEQESVHGSHSQHHQKSHDEMPHKTKHHQKKNQQIPSVLWVFIGLALILFLYNQWMIFSLKGLTAQAPLIAPRSSSAQLGSLDLDALKSTAHTIAAVFPLDQITSEEDALQLLIPTGTPPYGEDLGVSFDDPVGSLAKLARMYRPLKAEVEKNNPEAWQRFLSLAKRPVGISCEYCCGVGPIGIDSRGNSRCGCQHNPALLSVALYLTAYTNYSDAEILREVMRWKTLFFPKNMVGLAMQLAGGDTSALQNVPSMVGGC